jgi:hypothetical protein
MSQHSRRLDDRIRELCARVIASENSDELNLILPELRTAIHEATERLRLRAAATLMGNSKPPKERRKLG